MTAYTGLGFPQPYHEAMSSIDHARWRKATLEEWNTLLVNTFEIFTQGADTGNYEPITISPDINSLGVSGHTKSSSIQMAPRDTRFDW